MLKIFYKIFTFFVIYIHHNSILFASENIKKIANEDFINSGKITQNINESELKNNDSTITNNQSNDNDIKDDASIFGAIKKVVDDKKVIKKFEIDDDKIFLNKDIFDEKNKEKLRKIVEEKVENYVPHFKFSQRIISDVSQTKNFGNIRNNFNDTNGIIRYYPAITFKNNIEFSGIFRFARFDNQNDIIKRQNNPYKSGSRTFENMGINISELNIKYSRNNSSIILGKFTANFGIAWRWNKGIFIHTLANQYNLNEKLGVAFITKYGSSKKTGVYNLSFSTFTNDRKNLDNSLFHRRDSDSKSQALPGDTRSLSSYSLALDINFDFSKNEKLLYHLARSHLVVNKNASSLPRDLIRNQVGYAYGMNYSFPINEEFKGETMLEYATIKNLNGNRGVSSNFLTTNVTLRYLNYRLMIGTSKNNISNVNAKSDYRRLSEINIGYQFDKNKYYDKIDAIIGYYQTLNDNINSKSIDKSIAILIRYYKNF